MKSPFWLGIFLMTNVAMAEPLLTRDEVLASAGRIDAALEQVLALQAGGKNAPSTPLTRFASDACFLRRASIDLGGHLPAPDEVAAFVADAHPQKRSIMIDCLLAGSAAAEWRFQRLADAFRVTDEVCDVSQAGYIEFMRLAAAADMPIDQWLGRLMLARGTLQDDPATAFLLRDQGQIEVTTAEVARAFLGQDIHCAGCHDHPFTDHTQRGFYEFAACFNAISPAEVASTSSGYRALNLLGQVQPFHLPKDYLYRDGRPGQQVLPAYLAVMPFPRDDPRSAFNAKPSSRNVREQLAQWLTSPDSSTLAAVTALRIWDWMFGLPAPPSQLRREPAVELESPLALWQSRGCGENVTFHYGSWLESHPEFAAALRIEFLKCGSRIGEFQRVLASTQAYQREAVLPDSLGLLRILPAPIVRRLPPEVLWDALSQKLRSIDLPQVPPAIHPLRVMGRGTRAWADQSRRPLSHELARLMMNSPLVTQATIHIAASSHSDDRTARTRRLFNAILGRPPGESEARAAQRHFEDFPDTAASDIAWALINTCEFLFES